MTEEIAKKVSELYKKKSDIAASISKILDGNYKISGIAGYQQHSLFGFSSDVSLDFISELKEFCLIKLNEQLKAIEEEIANIDCKQ